MKASLAVFFELFFIGAFHFSTVQSYPLHFQKSVGINAAAYVSTGSILQHPFSIALKNTNCKNSYRYKNALPLQAIKGPIRYSANDWVECLTSLPTSRILKRTKWAILSNTIWTTFLVLLFKYKSITFAFPSIVHSIVGSALSLLLVFRTNSSYDRFWEARKLWTSIICSCRDIGRLTYIHIEKEHHERIAKLLIAFTIILKQHLQGE